MKNKYTVVTSFPVSNWEIYGQSFMESFIKHWPEEIKLLVYCDGYPLPDDIPTAPNVEYFDLLESDALLEFKERNKQFNGFSKPNSPYNFYEDAVKFSHKVYAQDLAMGKCIEENFKGWLIWLDADSVTYEDITTDLLDSMFDNEYDIAYLGRQNAYASCSSLIGYNLNSEVTPVFMSDFVNYYNSDEVLSLRCFADNFVFDRLRTLHEVHGMKSLDYTPECTGLEAFDLCPLGNHIVHLKGKIKYGVNHFVGKNTDGTRYFDLCRIVQHYKRKNILEIGTWNGENASAMIQAAFNESDEVHYTGIDLFTQATEETDKKEFNVKKHYTKKSVEIKLATAAKEYAKQNKKFTYYLMEGDSKEKLKILQDPSLCNMYNIKPDIVFIDGGHSIETVESDYEFCKDIPVIILDDYYTENADGEIPEKEFQGVNRLFQDKLGGTDRTGKQRRIIVSSSDKVTGGGIANLAVIINDETLENLPDFHRVPVNVQPRDCVPPDNIQDNVLENIKLFEGKIIHRCYWHDGVAVIASAGPSLEETLPQIKELYDKGAKVVCVKHSHNTLIDYGIIPWGCVILDPRPFDGESTHGIVRRELLKTPHPDTKYIVASMTNKEVTQYLYDKGAKIYGWHAFTNALVEMPELQEEVMITGGTCSAMRSIGVMHTLGFRKFHIFGMDCAMDGEPDDPEEKDMYGRTKWVKTGILNEKTKEEKTFYTTGELLALAQDFEALLQKSQSVDMELFVYGKGMVPALFEASDYKTPPKFEDEYNE